MVAAQPPKPNVVFILADMPSSAHVVVSLADVAVRGGEAFQVGGRSRYPKR
jgi:hypothetical protein